MWLLLGEKLRQLCPGQGRAGSNAVVRRLTTSD
jgi:hypothetical protein